MPQVIRSFAKGPVDALRVAGVEFMRLGTQITSGEACFVRNISAKCPTTCCASRLWDFDFKFYCARSEYFKLHSNRDTRLPLDPLDPPWQTARYLTTCCLSDVQGCSRSYSTLALSRTRSAAP